MSASKVGVNGQVIRAWRGPPRACVHCGEVFTPRHPNSRYCATKCRTATRYAARVTPERRLRIYERDGWLCYLCGEPVERGSTFSRRMASLDHVVALGNGGDPEDDENLRTAHFACNASKSVS